MKRSRATLREHGLQSLGFSLNSQVQGHWNYDAKALKDEAGWQLLALEISATDKAYLCHAGLVCLDLRAFTQRLRALTAEQFPTLTALHAYTRNDGALYLWAEFGPQLIDLQDLDHIDSGLAALALRWHPEKLSLSISLSEHCRLGQVPQTYFCRILPLIIQALGHNQGTKYIQSLFEIRLPFQALLNSAMALTIGPKTSQTLPEELLQEQAASSIAILSLSASRLIIALRRQPNLDELPKAPPLETLEARELETHYQDFDLNMITGDVNSLNARLSLSFVQTKNSWYLLRRLLLVGLHGESLIPEAQFMALTAQASETPLVLSAQIARSKPGSKPQLQYLSKLYHYLKGITTDTDSMPMLDQCLVELVAEALTELDPSKAVLAYKRILELRGEEPRILLKLSTIAKKQGAQQEELHYLQRLLQCSSLEPSNRLMILKHSAALAAAIAPNKAKLYAHEALTINPLDSPWALSLAELFIESRQIREAITIMTTALSLPDVDEPTRFKLELELAKAWLDDLDRPDLALKHAEAAYARKSFGSHKDQKQIEELRLRLVHVEAEDLSIKIIPEPNKTHHLVFSLDDSSLSDKDLPLKALSDVGSDVESSLPQTEFADEVGHAHLGNHVSLQSLNQSHSSALINESDNDKKLPSTQHNSQFNPHEHSHATLVDWRDVVLKAELTPNMTTKLLDLAFESELEKHIALQAFAVLSGELRVLKQWQFRVWRHPNEFTYPLSKSQRMPEAFASEWVGSRLHSLLEALTPILTRLYADEFSLAAITRVANLSLKDIERLREGLSWQDSKFKHYPLTRYHSFLEEQHFKAFNLVGLGQRLFFDRGSRGLYFDLRYFDSMPPTHLFHRIMITVKAIQKGSYFFLVLDPEKKVLPTIDKLSQLLASGKKSSLKAKFGLDDGPFKAALKQSDQEHLTRLISRMNEPNVKDLKTLYANIWESHFIAQLAETLDFIGLIEALGNLDLFAQPFAPLEILSLVPEAKGLLQVLTKFRV